MKTNLKNPYLTQDQRISLQNQFKTEFIAIIKELPEDKQKIWDGELLFAINQLTIPSGIHSKFPPKIADKFLALLNKYELVV